MALNLNRSRLPRKKTVNLDPTVDYSTLERGQVMVRAGFNAAGEALYAPSDASANESVAGILMLSEVQQSESPLIETLEIPASAPFTLTLKELPSAIAEIRAYDVDAGTARTVVSGSSPGASELAVDLTTGVVTADSALAEDTINIVYRFAISAATLESRAGVRSSNQGGEDLYNIVEIAYGECVVYTSLFDTEDAWEVDANTDVLSGGGGRISLDGTGTSFGTKVHEPVMLLTPGLEQAFVGYDCNLPG